MSNNGFNNYPGYRGMTTAVPNNPTFIPLKGQRVSSFNEVQAIPVDFDGSVFYFPDSTNKRIYTKQIGMDGTAIYNVYEKSEMPLNAVDGQFITRTEFDNVIGQIRNMLQQIVGQQAQPMVQQSQPQMAQPQMAAQPQQQQPVAEPQNNPASQF